jgi:hypothetical protein
LDALGAGDESMFLSPPAKNRPPPFFIVLVQCYWCPAFLLATEGHR